MQQNDKVKKQYNIEKENEDKINKDIELIMSYSTTQKDLLQFVEKIREYRTKIYELKMQLKESILEAYEMKRTRRYTSLEYEKIYNKEEDERELRKTKMISEEKSKNKYGEERNLKIEHISSIEKANILKATRIFSYYEQEIEFWQEMNLKKVMEFDQEQHYLE